MISHFDPIVALNLIVRSSLLRATHLLIMLCLFYQICFKSFFIYDRETSEGSEESKGELDRCSVRGDRNLSEPNNSKRPYQLVKDLTWG